MKTVTSFVIGMLVVLALAIPAEAQYRNPRTEQARGQRTTIYGTPIYGSGGYNDPRMLDPRLYNLKELPPLEIEECQYQECAGRKGTFHYDRGVLHFRAYDSTHNPTNMNHKNCKPILSAGRSTVQQSGEAPVSYREPTETPTPQPTASTVVAEKKIVRNRFETAPIRVYVGSKKILELSAGSEDVEIEASSSDRIWGEAYLENPKNGKMEWIPLQVGKGIDNLPEKSGWVFGNPDTRPVL